MILMITAEMIPVWSFLSNSDLFFDLISLQKRLIDASHFSPDGKLPIRNF